METGGIMSDITFDGNEATFSIKVIGEYSEESYFGKFKVRCILSPIIQTKADKLRRQIIGEHAAYASTISQQYAFMLSELHYRVIEGPVWWKSDTEVSGGHIDDVNVMSEILMKALEAEEKWKSRNKKEMEDAISSIKDSYNGTEPEDTELEED